jgi:hypothetical protein
MGLYPQFLTKYDAAGTDAGITLMLLRFLVGASGAITSYSRQANRHVTSVVRLAAGYYSMFFDGVYYVTRNAALTLVATPFTPFGDPSVIGPLSTTAGTIGQWVNDQSASQNARNIAFHSSDAVVASTKTFTIGNGAFTAADVGGKFNVFGSAQGNDGAYTIASVTSSTVIVVVETVNANETFTSAQSFSVSGAWVVFAFSQTGTPGAADVASGSEASVVFSLKTEAP